MFTDKILLAIILQFTFSTNKVFWDYIYLKVGVTRCTLVLLPIPLEGSRWFYNQIGEQH